MNPGGYCGWQDAIMGYVPAHRGRQGFRNASGLPLSLSDVIGPVAAHKQNCVPNGQRLLSVMFGIDRPHPATRADDQMVNVYYFTVSWA